jgi:probable F420-dependent oxidoreductase
VEERGYESLWMGEHSHIPASRRTPYPAGGEMPAPYKNMADPFVSLAVAATATKRLRLGLGVCLVLERDLFTLAKEVATLDGLSGGRFLFGIGVGWNQEEFENVAKMRWVERYSGLEDAVAAMRALWTEEAASYRGRWYKFDPVWSYPKPEQKPYPPVLLGVAGKLGMSHAARWGDGWMPIAIPGKDFAPRLERFRDMVREAGRDPEHVAVSVHLMGEPDLDRVRSFRDLGVTRIVISGQMGGDGLDAKLRLLDRFAPLVKELA